MLGDTGATVNIVQQVIHIPRINYFRMVNVYMLLSKMQLSASHVLLLNQRILFVQSLLFFGGGFPKYIVPDEDIYDEPNSLLGHVCVYTYQGGCVKTWYNSKCTNFIKTL